MLSLCYGGGGLVFVAVLVGRMCEKTKEKFWYINRKWVKRYCMKKFCNRDHRRETVVI
jgi:hypothetical protein